MANLQFVSVSTALLHAASTDLIIAKPAGAAQNDILIAIVAATSGGWSVPSGWTLIHSETLAGGGFKVDTFHKILGASEAVDYTFTCSTSHHLVGAIACYRGQDFTTPIDVFAFTDVNDVAAPFTETFPDITPTKQVGIVRVVGGVKGPDTPGAPTGHIVRTHARCSASDTNTDVFVTITDKLVLSASAPGTAEITYTGSPTTLPAVFLTLGIAARTVRRAAMMPVLS